MRVVQLALAVAMLAPASAQAQASIATVDSLATTLARVIGATLDSEYVATVRSGHVPMPLIIEAPGLAPGTAARLTAALTHSAHSRLSAPGDSDAHSIRVTLPVIHGDSAHVIVDDARLQCRQRFESASGSQNRYDFVRDVGKWRFVRSEVEMYYDPPPPPPAGIMSAGCPDFHVPDHPLPLDSARTLADTLQSLERASWVAWQARDSSVFARFLSPDHIDVGPSGRVARADVLVGVASPACVVRAYLLDQFRLTRLDDHMAVLTYHAWQTTRCSGVPVPSPVWATSVYVYGNGRWLNALYQQTPVPGPPPYTRSTGEPRK